MDERESDAFIFEVCCYYAWKKICSKNNNTKAKRIHFNMPLPQMDRLLHLLSKDAYFLIEIQKIFQSSRLLYQ